MEYFILICIILGCSGLAFRFGVQSTLAHLSQAAPEEMKVVLKKFNEYS